jgi:hypothetical protein
VLGAPVGGVDAVDGEDTEHGVTFVAEVLDEAAVGVVGMGCLDEQVDALADVGPGLPSPAASRSLASSASRRRSLTCRGVPRARERHDRAGAQAGRSTFLHDQTFEVVGPAIQVPHEYVRGTVTTNHAEGYFSQLRRSLDGTYHRVSVEHLPRHLAEFDFRFTNSEAERLAAHGADRRSDWRTTTPLQSDSLVPPFIGV